MPDEVALDQASTCQKHKAVVTLSVEDLAAEKLAIC
jgi:hypothetical protein